MQEVAASSLAYLDGGSGSMFIQIALSGVLTLAFVYRSALAKVKAQFKRIAPPK
jgi:hypothetical protein